MTGLGHVYRMLFEVRRLPEQTAPDDTGFALISVAVLAGHPGTARELALDLLVAHGFEPVGAPIRTTDLTNLFAEQPDMGEDSAFGGTAAEWLKAIHDETLLRGTSVRVLSTDYGFLDEPRRLDQPWGRT